MVRCFGVSTKINFLESVYSLLVSPKLKKKNLEETYFLWANIHLFQSFKHSLDATAFQVASVKMLKIRANTEK